MSPGVERATMLLGLLLCAPTGLAWQSAVVSRGGVHLATRAALSPQLRPRASFAARLAAAPAVPEPESQGWRAKMKLPPADEMRKIVPLAIMFFCILFNYTILRDTKDVLVVTAPGSCVGQAGDLEEEPARSVARV